VDSEFPNLPEESEEFSIKGEITHSGVPFLLRSLLASRETGILTFRSGDVSKSVYMREGQVVFVTSTDPDERLGESLLVRGKITFEQFLEASKLIRPGRRLGAILVELSALDSDDLIPAVDEQIRDILLDLFVWKSGEYEFVIKQIDLAGLVTVNVPVDNLILEALRRNRFWSSVLRGIGSTATVPVLSESSETAYKLDLTEDEQQVLSHVNGRSSIEQICQVSFLSNFETCRVLWALQVLGIIAWTQVGGEDETGAAPHEEELDLEDIVEKFNRMFNRIHVFLKGRLGDDVDAFMDRVTEAISRQYGVLFEGVDLKLYGRADFEQMLANVADLPAEQRKSLMVSALNELVYVVQLEVRQSHGAEEEAVVAGIIKDGLRKIGAV